MARRLAREDTEVSDLQGRGREGELPDSSRVAVVDDDRSMREALRALLRSVGFRVETFGSAEDFLRTAQPSKFECLVLDVRMSGMSGVELHEHLISSGATLPVVFMTAHADAGVRARAMGHGPVEFLEKPFSDDALLEAIEVSLGRWRP